MTRYLLDVASYQGALKPADVKRAGCTAVNLKTSHGVGQKSVHPDVADWALESHLLGLGISTFHYFTADAGGIAQAEYAYACLRSLGLVYGTAHQLDVESTPVPLLAEVRAYLERMTLLLGRPVVLYTGDWWWTARAGRFRRAMARILPRRPPVPRRVWNVSDLTPYLWAAPNAGYPGSYPGDTSSKWTAGYGGWPALSVMQYAVGPLSFPDGTKGTIDVSKSAIRHETVWRDLTLGRPGMSTAPASLKVARLFYMDTLKTAGYTINPASVGIVGDDSHAKAGTSYHLGEDALMATAYSIVESARDRNGLTNAAAAVDYGWFSFSVAGKAHNLRTFSVWLVAQCKAGAGDTLDIREVIYSADGSVVKRWDRLGKRTTGDSSHTSHTHVSYFRDSEGKDKTALLRRYFTEIGVLEDEDMPTAQEVVDELMTRNVVAGGVDYGDFNGVIATISARSRENRERTSAILAGNSTILTAVQAVAGADVDEAAIIAGVLQGMAGQTGDAAAAIAQVVIDAIPEEIAVRVAQEIGDRLAGASSARHAAAEAAAERGEDLTGGAAEGRQTG